MLIETLRFYYRYLFSKASIIFWSLLFLVWTVLLLGSAGVFEGYGSMDLDRHDGALYYLYDLVLYAKLLSVVMTVLIAYMLGNDHAHDLERFVIDTPIRKMTTLCAKILLMLSLILWQIAIWLMIALVVHRFLTPYPVDLKFYLDLYLALVQLNSLYLFVTFLGFFVVRSVLMMVPPLALFWFIAITHQQPVEELNQGLKLLKDIVPNVYFNEAGIQMTGRFTYYLMTMVLIGSVMFLLKINQDIK